MENLEEVSNYAEKIINEFNNHDKVSQKIKTKAVRANDKNNHELILSAAPHLYKEDQIYYENEVKKEYTRALILMRH